jgi:hypothetical protein
VISPTHITLVDSTHQSEATDVHAPGGIRNPNPRKLAAAVPRLRRVMYETLTILSLGDGWSKVACFILGQLYSGTHRIGEEEVHRARLNEVAKKGIPACRFQESKGDRPVRIQSMYFAIRMTAATQSTCRVNWERSCVPASLLLT